MKKQGTYYERNKELVKQRSREWALANPEKHKQRLKEWRENNPERVRQSYKKRYDLKKQSRPPRVKKTKEEKLEKRRKTQDAYYQKNKEKLLFDRRKKYANSHAKKPKKTGMTREEKKAYMKQYMEKYNQARKQLKAQRIAATEKMPNIENSDKAVKIMQFVCEYFGVTPDFIKQDSRKRKVVEPRQIAMFLMVKVAKLTTVWVGKYFGDKDHTTVMHSCTTVENLMYTNKFYKEGVLSLQNQIAA